MFILSMIRVDERLLGNSRAIISPGSMTLPSKTADTDHGPGHDHRTRSASSPRRMVSISARWADRSCKPPLRNGPSRTVVSLDHGILDRRHRATVHQEQVSAIGPAVRSTTWMRFSHLGGWLISGPTGVGPDIRLGKFTEPRSARIAASHARRPDPWPRGPPARFSRAHPGPRQPETQASQINTIAGVLFRPRPPGCRRIDPSPRVRHRINRYLSKIEIFMPGRQQPFQPTPQDLLDSTQLSSHTRRCREARISATATTCLPRPIEPSSYSVAG